VTPLFIVFAGLPGTGKSTLSRAVAERWDATWLRVDVAEAAMLRAGLPRSFETGLAAYLTVRDIAGELLRLGRNVVVDAVNGIEWAHALWRTLAAETGARLFVVQLTCSDRDEHRRRVETREAPTPPLPLPTWAEGSEREYLPWTDPVLTVDPVEPPEACLARILAYLPEPTGRRDRAPGTLP